jgi:hypothetical protein
MNVQIARRRYVERIIVRPDAVEIEIKGETGHRVPFRPFPCNPDHGKVSLPRSAFASSSWASAHRLQSPLLDPGRNEVAEPGAHPDLMSMRQRGALLHVDDDAGRSPTYLRRPVGLMKADLLSDDRNHGRTSEVSQ